MRTATIYKLLCPVSGECRYIGKTIKALSYRLHEHKKMCFNPRFSLKDVWFRELFALNMLESIQIEEIETVSIDIVNNREKYWISVYSDAGFNLTNSTKGGEGQYNYKISEKYLHKWVENGKLKKGMKFSEESKKKISDSLIGNTRHKDKPHSAETKKKISENKKCTPCWNAKPVLQFLPSGEFVREWISAGNAAKVLGFSQGNICCALNGKRRAAHGYIWKFK